MNDGVFGFERNELLLRKLLDIAVKVAVIKGEFVAVSSHEMASRGFGLYLKTIVLAAEIYGDSDQDLIKRIRSADSFFENGTGLVYRRSRASALAFYEDESIAASLKADRLRKSESELSRLTGQLDEIVEMFFSGRMEPVVRRFKFIEAAHGISRESEAGPLSDVQDEDGCVENLSDRELYALSLLADRLEVDEDKSDDDFDFYGDEFESDVIEDDDGYGQYEPEGWD